jgi:hypothetical protein
MTFFSWYWLIWVFLFCIGEYFAITNGVPGDTLSEQVWLLIGTGTEGSRTAVNWVWRVGILALLAWLIPHFMTGWSWFGKNKKKDSDT